MRRRTGFAFALALLALAASPSLPGLRTAGEAAAQVKHNCGFCHNLHGGSYAALRDTAVVEDLCTTCHSTAAPDSMFRDGVKVNIPNGPFGVHNGAKHLFGPAGSQVQVATGCWDCHNHEGEAGSNLKMIQGSMPTPDTSTAARLADGSYTGSRRTVVFTSLGKDAVPPQDSAKSFADGDGTYDGVCEVCHSRTSNHGNGQPGDPSSHAHNSGADCRVCHKHNDGFKASGSCASCHKGSQSARRPIIPEFERTSHHVNWSAFPNGLSADSIQEATCKVCHDQTKHKQGNVRLWNVDQPLDTLQSIVLTGNPLTTQTEADKLAPFCLACHDANGANGDLTPFDEGGSPPVVITPAAWTTVSHNKAGKVSCFGCHGSGHGSEKTKLLMPDVGAVSTPDSANVQEGFCLRCHDADGPASTNLATFFNTAINWVQSPAGLADNPNLNDRHDVQYAAQTRSGAKIECTSCHSPHTLTTQRKYILDPDPTDGHVPGTNYYFYSATVDTLSEFCLDCHDGSFPAGVLSHQNYALTNIRTTTGVDGMGNGVSARIRSLRSGTGWVEGDLLACRVCHTTHGRVDVSAGIPNLFGAVDTVRNKAGSAYLPFVEAGNTFNYSVTDNSNSNSNAVTSGGYWCNACHNKTNMNSKANCYSCHRHGQRF